MKTNIFKFFFVVLGIAFFSFPAFATDVGGIIYADTTWDLAGSPYNFIERVTIADGVTLTIDPGVVVNPVSGAAYNPIFEVWGTLDAIGTDTSPITLNGVRTEQGTSSAVINIQYAVINGGGPFRCMDNFSLRDSKINNLVQIDACGNNSYIERNVFVGCRDIDGVTGAKIRNNVFYEQTGPAIAIKIHGNSAIIEHNSFLSTDRIALYAAQLTADFSAANNFWNTTVTSVIDSMIWDHNDEYGQPYYILYEEILEEPHSDTPILDFNQVPVSNSGDDQVVYEQVTLNGTGSFDPDGSIVSHYWSLQHRTNSANDRTASGDNPTVYDLNPGFYDVYLTVTDDGGLVDVDNILLAVAGSCPISPIPDQDEDSEPDLTDICPNTPLDLDVDNNGCSLEQFCSSIDTSSHHGRRICNRSDWQNDEPLKNKGDCKAFEQGRGSHNYQCVPR